MSVRAALRALILSDAEIVALIPASRWGARGSVYEDVLDRPFGIITTVGDNRFLRGARREEPPRDFEIWVHDNPGSYVRIDDVMALLRKRFEATADFQFGGQRLAQVDVQSESPDLEDDIQRTVTRSLRVRVTGGTL